MERTLKQMVDEVIPVSYTTYHGDFVRALAKEADKLLKERENNPGVWDGAPEWATEARVQWTNGRIFVANGLPEHAEWREENYTRTLPKTKAREIAEKRADEWRDRLTDRELRDLSTLIESAILEAKKDGAS